MEQPREFDPFMCMWGGGWARLGASGRGPSQGAGLEYSLARPICPGRDFPGVAPGFSTTPPSSEGREYPPEAEPLGAMLL